MRSLHVAALPFPTQQGTQAAIHAMLEALCDAGQAPELLCYAHGAFARAAPPYCVHRVERTLGLSSLRSGPSLQKLAVDLLLVRKLRATVQTQRPDWVVAHHVEAALACIAARIPRFAFVAHTSLAEELRFYVPEALASVCNRMGLTLDRLLCRRATRVLAISPLLTQQLRRQSGANVELLRLPWSVPRSAPTAERELARRQLGFTADDEVVLYAGNLDAYQGLSVLGESLHRVARERPRVSLLLASQASHAERARFTLPIRVRHMTLADEADRRRAHAAADVVAVPRASAGGLPIKLLDALARGARVVAARRAVAGLALDAVCTVVDSDDPSAFAHALLAELSRSGARLDPCDRERAETARAYVAQAHSKQAFVADFVRILRARPTEYVAPARSSSELFPGGDKVP